MRITIDGLEMTEHVSVDDQWVRAGKSERPVSPYVLEVARDEACRIFASYYADYLADSKAHPPDEHDGVERQILTLNCATLVDLLARDGPLFERFIGEVAYDFVQALMVAQTAHKNPRFFIQSVEQISLGPDSLTLAGSALDLRRDLLNKAAAKMPNGEAIPPGDEPGFMSNYDIEEDDD